MKKSKLIPSLAGCLTAQLCVGILYVWSVLKPAAMSYYGWSDGSVNLVSSFMLFAFCFGNLVGGALNDRIGPRIVCFAGMLLFGGGILLASLLPADSSVVLFYVCYCAVGGMGSGFTYGAVISCIQKWLPHRRGFASGLGTSAFGFATVIFSPLISSMLSAMPISSALRILSLAFLAVGVVSCIFIRLPSAGYVASLPAPAPKKTGIASARDMKLSEAVRTVPFWCLLLSLFFYNGTWNLLNPLIKGLGVQRGLSEAAAVAVVSLTGLTNAAGRLIMATLSDRIGRVSTIYILSGVTCACALLLCFAGGYAYFGVVLLTAFAYGGPSAVNPATSTDLFGAKYSGTNYGVMMLALGASSICFNALSNTFYAATGTYTLTFIMGAVTALITVGTFAVIDRSIRKMR